MKPDLKPTSLPAQWEVLALLRFVLAWIVFCSHIKDFLPLKYPAIQLSVDLGGRAAVLGFLVVSGYSIASSIQRKPDGFYRRRFFRIYPLYFTAILLTQLMAFALENQVTIPSFIYLKTGLPTTVCNLFFLQTFACVSIGYNPVVWTLGIEVFYYVLAPIFNRINKYFLLSIGLLSGLFSLNFVDVLAYFRFPTWSVTFFGISALSYLWAWLFGFIYFKSQDKRLGFILAVIGIMFILPNKTVFYEPLSWLTYGITFLCVTYATSISLSKNLSKLFAYLGDISYPFYLFHIPLLIASYVALKVENPWFFIIITLLGSAFFYHLVDGYLKRKWSLK